MMSNADMLKKINHLCETDPRYRREAYLFVLAGLEFTLQKIAEVRHLTGQELSRGIAGYAREQYGYMARDVLENWGVRTTLDFGEIVYNLIGEGLMRKTEDDRREDFADVYDFAEEFTWENARPTQFPPRFE